jgi:hypothetical protein
MESARLRAFYASDRCRNDSELLVAVWSELRLRERDLQALGEPTIERGGGDES